MPKLNLQTAIAIKGSGGEFAAIKGPGGILWTKPATTGPVFNVQHFNPDVVSAGQTQAIAEVSSLDNAFVMMNSNNRMSAGPRGTTGNIAPDDMGLIAQLSTTTAVDLDREPTASGNAVLSSFSVWEYIGVAGGADEFIVRDRRTITLSSITAQSFTPPGVVDPTKVVLFLSARSNRINSSNYDHAMAGAWIDRVTGEVSVEGQGADGVLTVEVTTVEFTGSNWTVRYGTDNAQTTDTGDISLDSSVNDWANALIIHNFAKNGAGNGAIADANAMYFPPIGGALDAVSYQFDGNHDGTTGQRHTVFVLEHAGMTVTRYRGGVTGPLEYDEDISALGITDLSKCLIQVSAESSGTGSAHGRGHRIAYFVDQNTIRAQAHRTGNGMNIEMQVVQLPLVGDVGGSPPASPPAADRAFGWGYHAVGGTTPYVVTSNANSGAGTLRDALSVTGRHITFDLPASSLISLSSRLDVLSTTKVDGIGSDVTLEIPGATGSGLFHINGRNNVVIRNVKMQDVGWDAISVLGASSNFWLDHITLVGPVGDGGFDITEQSTEYTVSYCNISLCRKTSLLGTGNNETPADAVMKGTYFRNYWYRNHLRQPFARWGKMHIRESVYVEWGENPLETGGSRAIESTLNAQAAIENCMFVAGSDKPAVDFTSSTITDDGYAKLMGTQYTENGATVPDNVPANVFDPLTEYRADLGLPAYDYTSVPGSASEMAVVIAESGWQPASFWT